MEKNNKIRVMIVDDSTVTRSLLRAVLTEDPDIEVVAQAVNGKLALPRVNYYKPELIILDNEMPEMTGLETLEVLRKDHPEVGVIMFSSHTIEGARVTIQALELGALDFVTKPHEGDGDAKEYIKNKLIALIKIISRKRRTGGIRVPSEEKRTTIVTPPAETVAARANGSYEVVGLGISTGGPAALRELLPAIPGKMHGAILVVQHMPPLFTKQLAESLNQITDLEVVEAVDGMPVQNGYVYIAPGGKHMIVSSESGRYLIRVTDTEPVANCKPSVNVLFKSIAEVYGRSAAAVIMTGMGNDGTEGMRLLKQKGSYLFAQNEASSLVYGMPAHPVKEGLLSESLDIQGIAGRIQELLG